MPISSYSPASVYDEQVVDRQRDVVIAEWHRGPAAAPAGAPLSTFGDLTTYGGVDDSFYAPPQWTRYGSDICQSVPRDTALDEASGPQRESGQLAGLELAVKIFITNCDQTVTDCALRIPVIIIIVIYHCHTVCGQNTPARFFFLTK